MLTSASVTSTYGTSMINLKVVLYNFRSHLESVISLYPFDDPVTQELLTLQRRKLWSQRLGNLPTNSADERQDQD